MPGRSGWQGGKVASENSQIQHEPALRPASRPSTPVCLSESPPWRGGARSGDMQEPAFMTQRAEADLPSELLV